MIKMDVKGITWVGNIYQKFETMCLEVEEIVYQDTVKYVENQVQTVGASVKKFYSEVMQDLLPPSSVESGKFTASEFSVEPCKDSDMKKAKLRMRRPAKTGIDKKTEDPREYDVKKEVVQASSFCRPCPTENMPPKPVRAHPEDMCCDLYRGQINDRAVPSNESPAVMDVLPTKTSMIVAPLKIENPYPSEPLTEDGKVTHKLPEISCAILEPTKVDQMEECTEDTEKESDHISDSILRSPSGMINKDEPEDKVRLRFPSPCGSCADSHDEPLDDEIVSLASSMEDVDSYKFFAKEANVSYSVDSKSDQRASTSNSEAQQAALDQNEKAKLDESCVLVNEDELHFLTCRDIKQKRYKKKIMDAFSSKKKASRTREYEQLALLCGDDKQLNKENKMMTWPALNSAERERSPAQNMGEHEWELL